MRKGRLIAAAGAAGIAVVTAGGLAVAGSGSSGKSRLAASGASASSAGQAASADATSPPLVTTKRDDTFGTILADGRGATLYTLTDNGRAVSCGGACASVWPPLELPSRLAAPTGGPGVADLGTAAGPGGARLVTAGGLPLYRYVQDEKPSDAEGDGIRSFGGVWHVVKGGDPSSM